MRRDGVTIELAQLGDVEAVLRLERSVVEAPHWASEVYREMVRGEGAVERRMVVARAGAEGVVGFAVAAVMGLEETERWGELESVAVEPAWRRSGVGRALCRELMRWCWERGGRWMELEVRAGSEGAQRMYGELGFAVMGRRRGYYSGPVEDAVLMRVEMVAGEGREGALVRF